MVHDIRMNSKVKKSGLADQQMNCVDHVINNALKAALKNKEVAPLVNTATELADGFHRSLKRTSLLCSTCNKLDIDYKKIPKPIATRWNSVCKTIKAITEMAPAFSKILGSGEIEGEFQDKLPSDQTVTTLIHLLQPLEQIKTWSELLEADNTPTIQFVVPALVNLCNITKTKDFEKCQSKATKTFCRQFEYKLKKQYQDYGRLSPERSIANFLHPLFKGSSLNEDDDKSHFFNKTKKWIIDKYTNDDDEEGEEEDED